MDSPMGSWWLQWSPSSSATLLFYLLHYTFLLLFSFEHAWILVSWYFLAYTFRFCFLVFGGEIELGKSHGGSPLWASSVCVVMFLCGYFHYFSSLI
uniref:Uncharacterized protein n=1 Tax=Triticum urartu TaxID=4572 RepID=A0A8R7PH57_TRIUA